jgi:DNA-binding SARP family transcriptional activator
LGRFEVAVDDIPLVFEGKAPKKPLSLLKALIAFGERNVPEERLMDVLWPDEEADSARKSLDITILRLRKLLGSHEAILVSDESVGLNPRLCWTDVSAFEKRAETAKGQRESGVAALELYRGNFLPMDADELWTTKTRERLRSKFVRLIEAVAQEEENAGNLDKAIILYLKGLEADDLVEPFYQGLMRCYRAQGRHAEAMSAYRRLRQLLSVVLGIAPSEATQSLARSLQRDNPAQSASP